LPSAVIVPAVEDRRIGGAEKTGSAALIVLACSGTAEAHGVVRNESVLCVGVGAIALVLVLRLETAVGTVFVAISKSLLNIGLR